MVKALFSTQGTRVRSLVGELRTHMPQGVVKIFKNRDTIDNRRAIGN